MTSIQPSQFINSRARRRLEAEAHNAKFDEIKRRRMPLVVPQPEPTPEPQLVQEKAKNQPLPGAVQMMFALMARAMSLPNRYRGYVTRRPSPRDQARAAGYSNVREMQALQRADELRRRAAEQQAA